MAMICGTTLALAHSDRVLFAATPTCARAHTDDCEHRLLWWLWWLLGGQCCMGTHTHTHTHTREWGSARYIPASKNLY